MTTLGDLATRLQNDMFGLIGRPVISTLNATINDAVTAFVCTSTPPDTLGLGSLVAIDYELMLVTSVSGTTVNVTRAYGGTTAASHTGGVLVEFEPRWPRGALIGHLADEIRALPRSLYRVTAVNLAFASGDRAADLTSAVDVHRIVNATRVSSSGAGYGAKKPRVSLLRGMATADYASGYAVQLDDGLSPNTSVTYRITYAHGFDTDPLAASTDLETTVGLPTSLLDGIRYGGGHRALLGRDIANSDEHTQGGNSRSADEVPPMTLTRVATQWRSFANARYDEEAKRLADTWGIPF